MTDQPDDALVMQALRKSTQLVAAIDAGEVQRLRAELAEARRERDEARAALKAQKDAIFQPLPGTTTQKDRAP